MIGDGYGCQEDANGDGVMGSTRVLDEDGVRDVRGEGWRRVAGFVSAITWGQSVTRPDGLLRTVGRISLNELYAFWRFKALCERGQ